MKVKYVCICGICGSKWLIDEDGWWCRDCGYNIIPLVTPQEEEHNGEN